MSLSNLESKLANLTDKILILTKDGEDLNRRYERVSKEKGDLEEKFERETVEVRNMPIFKISFRISV
jgi:predicted  nucleic acid-binding Zn-ribbon protein